MLIDLNGLKTALTAVLNTIGNKMDKNNPSGTGSFSLNRKEGSTIGNHSVAIGEETTASATASFAEGAGTTASSSCSHAEGYCTTATGELAAHAEGISTTASDEAAHAEGQGTTASGRYSHAEGVSSTASGEGAHAEGLGVLAYGEGSHAEGLDTKASSKYQHVQGQFNIEDSNNVYAHIVGNGIYDQETNQEVRSNAHTLDWNGNAWFSGNIKIGGASQEDTTASSVLTTANFVLDGTTLTITTS